MDFQNALSMINDDGYELVSFNDGLSSHPSLPSSPSSSFLRRDSLAGVSFTSSDTWSSGPSTPLDQDMFHVGTPFHQSPFFSFQMQDDGCVYGPDLSQHGYQQYKSEGMGLQTDFKREFVDVATFPTSFRLQQTCMVEPPLNVASIPELANIPNLDGGETHSPTSNTFFKPEPHLEDLSISYDATTFGQSLYQEEFLDGTDSDPFVVVPSQPDTSRFEPVSIDSKHKRRRASPRPRPRGRALPRPGSHSAPTRTHHCGTCLKTFGRVEHCTRHERTHLPGPRIECPLAFLGGPDTCTVNKNTHARKQSSVATAKKKKRGVDRRDNFYQHIVTHLRKKETTRNKVVDKEFLFFLLRKYFPEDAENFIARVERACNAPNFKLGEPNTEYQKHHPEYAEYTASLKNKSTWTPLARI